MSARVISGKALSEQMSSASFSRADAKATNHRSVHRLARLTFLPPSVITYSISPAAILVDQDGARERERFFALVLGALLALLKLVLDIALKLGDQSL